MTTKNAISNSGLAAQRWMSGRVLHSPHAAAGCVTQARTFADPARRPASHCPPPTPRTRQVGPGPPLSPTEGGCRLRWLACLPRSRWRCPQQCGREVWRQPAAPHNKHTPRQMGARGCVGAASPHPYQVCSMEHSLRGSAKYHQQMQQTPTTTKTTAHAATKSGHDPELPPPNTTASTPLLHPPPSPHLHRVARCLLGAAGGHGSKVPNDHNDVPHQGSGLLPREDWGVHGGGPQGRRRPQEQGPWCECHPVPTRAPRPVGGCRGSGGGLPVPSPCLGRRGGGGRGGASCGALYKSTRWGAAVPGRTPGNLVLHRAVQE